MNILIVNWQDWKNPFAGGAEVYLYEIFSRLAKRGHNIILLCSRGKGQSRFEELDGIKIYRIGRRSNFNFLVPVALRALLRRNKVEVVVDDLNKIPFYSPIFTRKKVLPMLMHLFRTTIYRETNFIFASYVFFTERVIPFMYAGSNFVAISHSTADDLREIGVRNKIYVVPCGISVIPSEIKEEHQDDLVAYVGRLKRYKSIDHFIDAVSLLQKSMAVEALVVGDGDVRYELMNRAQQLKAKIKFTGFVGEEEKYRIYSRARVVVQPSVKEGWGLTAIEAQSCGTPVVCADSPGLREVVRNGETGFLYPYGDVNRLSDRIKELLTDRPKWRKFSVAAKKWAQKFSWDNAALEIERILEEEIYRGKI